MPVITKIERQKHDARRVSVFVDGEFSFSVFDEIVVEFHLAPGKNADDAETANAKCEDEYLRALDKAVKHLSHSEKSEKQMTDFLIKNGFSENAVVRATAHLKEIGYIDDERLASLLAEHNRSLGVRALKFKMKQRGLDEKTIEHACESTDEDALALACAKKQLVRFAKLDEREKKKKISDYLARHGFSWDTVSLAVEKAMEEDEC